MSTTDQSSAAVHTDALKKLIAEGLPALKAGLEQAQKHIDDIIDAATHPKLQQMLQQGKQTSERWVQRVETAMQSFDASCASDNPIVEAHGEVAQRIRQQAPTDGVRDLGIIASGQLALHYWVAAFGTMASYAKATDEMDAAEHLAACVDEAKEADEMHTQLAYEMMGRTDGSQANHSRGGTSQGGTYQGSMNRSASFGENSDFGTRGGATVNQERVSETDGTQPSHYEFAMPGGSSVSETMTGNGNAEVDLRDLRHDELSGVDKGSRGAAGIS